MKMTILKEQTMTTTMKNDTMSAADAVLMAEAIIAQATAKPEQLNPLMEKVSVLMRRGAAIRAQAYHTFFQRVNYPIWFLSDAQSVLIDRMGNIRKSKKQPQDEIRSCAMGAVYEAAFGSGIVEALASNSPSGVWDQISMSQLPDDSPLARMRADGGMYQMPCECGQGLSSAVGPSMAVIMHLNDTHHWTREAIADWLDGIGL